MPFELRPVSTPSGDFAPAWFDDKDYLWEADGLQRLAPLTDTWKPPRLFRYQHHKGPTAVLYNPRAYAFSRALRDQLEHLPGTEFLPIDVVDTGPYFILHPTVGIPLPLGSDHRRNEVSGNVADIRSLPSDFTSPHPIFRIMQPTDSAAGARNSCCSGIYVDGPTRALFEGVCAGLLFARVRSS